MHICQDKAKNIKILKKQHELVTNELKYFQIISEVLQISDISQVKKMSDKSSDEREVSLHEFVLNGFDMTKLASMIYGISRNKGDVISFS